MRGLEFKILAYLQHNIIFHLLFDVVFGRVAVVLVRPFIPIINPPLHAFI